LTFKKEFAPKSKKYVYINMHTGSISSYSFKYLNGNSRVYPIMVTHLSKIESNIHKYKQQQSTDSNDEILYRLGQDELKPKPMRKSSRWTPHSQPYRHTRDIDSSILQFQQGFIYTIPLEKKFDTNQNQNQSVEVINAVLAFTCPSLAHYFCDEISAAHNSIHDQYIPCTAVEVELADLKHFSSILRLPLITVVNAFCSIENIQEPFPALFDYKTRESNEPLETFELYYYYKPQDVTGIPMSLII
jgi:hypothetical protein